MRVSIRKVDLEEVVTDHFWSPNSVGKDQHLYLKMVIRVSRHSNGCDIICSRKPYG